MNKGLFFFKCVLLAILAIALLGFVTMHLWNWLVPDLFHGPYLNYWQTLGLLLLTKILFWGFGGKKHHGGPGGPAWKQRYEKFSSMTPEQRAEFKRRMKEKWCHVDARDKDGNAGSSNV